MNSLFEVAKEQLSNCFEGRRPDVIDFINEFIFRDFFLTKDYTHVTINFTRRSTTLLHRKFRDREARYILRAAFTLLQILVSKENHFLTFEEMSDKYKDDNDNNTITTVDLCRFRNVVATALSTMASKIGKTEVLMYIGCALTNQELFSMGSGMNNITLKRKMIVERETECPSKKRKKRNPLFVLANEASKRICN